MAQQDLPDFNVIQKTVEPINGWFARQAHMLFDAFLRYQNGQDIAGHAMEIGTWHGKAATSIAPFIRDDEYLFLIDPAFGIPEIKTIVQNNLKKVCGELPQSFYFGPIKSSALFKLDDFKPVYRKMRFMHIDGDHSGRAVYEDLEAAHMFLADDGIVAVDDFFSIHYPQITQAVFRYCHEHPYRLVPFLCGYNKAFLCRPESLAFYHDYLVQNIPDEMKQRGQEVTLTKSSSLADSTIIAIENRDETLAPYDDFCGHDSTPAIFEHAAQRKHATDDS